MPYGVNDKQWPSLDQVMAKQAIARTKTDLSIGPITWWRHQMENIFRVTGHLYG